MLGKLKNKLRKNNTENYDDYDSDFEHENNESYDQSIFIEEEYDPNVSYSSSEGSSYQEDNNYEENKIYEYNERARALAARNGEEGYWDYDDYYHYFDDEFGYYDAQGNYYLHTHHLSNLEKIKNSILGIFSYDYDLSNIPIPEKIALMDDAVIKDKGYAGNEANKPIISSTELINERLDNGRNNPTIVFYFDVEKTLDHFHLGFLKRFDNLMIFLDQVTAGNNFLHNWSEKVSRKALAYNKLSVKQKYTIDRKKSMRKTAILSSFALIITSVLVFKVIPDRRENSAQTALVSGDYQTAYKYYNKRDKDGIYTNIAQSFIYIDEGELEKAEALMKETKEMKSSLALIDFQEVYLQFTKKLGKEYEVQGNIADTARVYRDITYDKEGKELYSENAYIAMHELFKKEDYFRAFDFGKSIIGYKDSERILNEMSADLYSKAMTMYERKQYNQSKELFAPLAAINYKNSETMEYQGDYALGVQAYLSGDYTRAISILSDMPDFKDSSAILTEVTFKEGMSLLENKPQEAYHYLYKSRNIAEAETALKSIPLVLYGEWNVTDKNDVKLNNIKLSYSLEDTLHITEPLDGLASGIYKYDKETSTYKGNDTELILEINGYNSIKLETNSGSVKVKYSLERESIPTNTITNEFYSNQELIDTMKDYLSGIIKESKKEGALDE